ncbi:hypothetical protein FEM48_Zijuj06G0189300 [Ziziphus jujuba var. spinosa]|uniref:Protein kinase domain-containing protein n=1 Tax=Ziziphus jujuba var. spinosa TaxID=714518 RepID=A0A978VB16_ZIZJJ|nr:hypothetical protein FEM48_Zijuj06G0189300 [Ziziphus jujuba var. spinosa]
MSSHKNVLKLLGCCLEFPLPILVYEDAENGPLNKWGSATTINGSNGSSTSSSLSWKMRLKVAKEIANALTYLHTAFSRPIIHRNINPQSVFLDKDHVAKLSDFSLSITIPEGQTHAEDAVIGTFGFVAPDYVLTRFVTEKADVYSFGRFMVILLIGLRKSTQDYNLRPETQLISGDHLITEIVDPEILEEGGGSISEEQQLQLQAFVELALRCVEVKGENRPRMIDVAKELQRIEKSTV